MEPFNTEVASTMVRQAIEDLEATEKKDNFVIDMRAMLEKSEKDNKYRVDLVGCVFSNRIDPDMELDPCKYGYRESVCFSAMSNISYYHLDSFVRKFYRGDVPEIAEELKKLEIPKTYYRDNPVVFKENMLKFADKLAELEDKWMLPPIQERP